MTGSDTNFDLFFEDKNGILNRITADRPFECDLSTELIFVMKYGPQDAEDGEVIVRKLPIVLRVTQSDGSPSNNIADIIESSSSSELRIKFLPRTIGTCHLYIICCEKNVPSAPLTIHVRESSITLSQFN